MNTQLIELVKEKNHAAKKKENMNLRLRQM